MARKRSAGKQFKALVKKGGLVTRASGKDGARVLVRQHEDAANKRNKYVVVVFDPLRDMKPVSYMYHSSRAAELAVMAVQPERGEWKAWDGEKEWWL